MNLKKLFRDIRTFVRGGVCLPGNFGDMLDYKLGSGVVPGSVPLPNEATRVIDGVAQNFPYQNWAANGYQGGTLAMPYYGGTASMNRFYPSNIGGNHIPQNTPARRKCLYCGSNVEGHDNCPRCGAPEN